MSVVCAVLCVAVLHTCFRIYLQRAQAATEGAAKPSVRRSH